MIRNDHSLFYWQYNAYFENITNTRFYLHQSDWIQEKKTVAFLYTKDKWTEKIFREATSLTIATINVKYFWGNLNQES